MDVERASAPHPVGVYSDPHPAKLIQFMKDGKVKVIIVKMLAQALQ